MMTGASLVSRYTSAHPPVALGVSASPIASQSPVALPRPSLSTTVAGLSATTSPTSGTPGQPAPQASLELVGFGVALFAALVAGVVVMGLTPRYEEWRRARRLRLEADESIFVGSTNELKPGSIGLEGFHAHYLRRPQDEDLAQPLSTRDSTPLLLVGRSGIGKTRMVYECVRGLSENALVVVPSPFLSGDFADCIAQVEVGESDCVILLLDDVDKFITRNIDLERTIAALRKRSGTLAVVMTVRVEYEQLAARFSTSANRLLCSARRIELATPLTEEQGRELSRATDGRMDCFDGTPASVMGEVVERIAYWENSASPDEKGVFLALASLLRLGSYQAPFESVLSVWAMDSGDSRQRFSAAWNRLIQLGFIEPHSCEWGSRSGLRTTAQWAINDYLLGRFASSEDVLPTSIVCERLANAARPYDLGIIGVRLAADGRAAEGLDVLRQGMALSTSAAQRMGPAALLTWIRHLEDRGEFEEALRVAELAWSWTPHWPFMMEQALLLLIIGRTDEAVAAWSSLPPSAGLPPASAWLARFILGSAIDVALCLMNQDWRSFGLHWDPAGRWWQRLLGGMRKAYISTGQPAPQRYSLAERPHIVYAALCEQLVQSWRGAQRNIAEAADAASLLAQQSPTPAHKYVASMLACRAGDPAIAAGMGVAWLESVDTSIAVLPGIAIPLLEAIRLQDERASRELSLALISSRPEQPAPYAYYAYSLLAEGTRDDTLRAIQSLSEAACRSQAPAKFFHEMSVANRRLNLPSEALGAARQAAAGDPSSPWYHLDVAESAFSLSQERAGSEQESLLDEARVGFRTGWGQRRADEEWVGRYLSAVGDGLRSFLMTNGDWPSGVEKPGSSVLP